MFIPESNESQDAPTINEAMNVSMTHLWDKYILPHIDKTDEEEIEMVTMIGHVLRDAQEKASAYDKLQSEKDYFSRN